LIKVASEQMTTKLHLQSACKKLSGEFITFRGFYGYSSCCARMRVSEAKRAEIAYKRDAFGAGALANVV
jgi:hypothetical protein